MSVYWGIDPGKTGALAVIDSDSRIITNVFRFKDKTPTDIKHFFKQERLWCDFCFIEKVGTMKQDGKIQIREFMQNYGMLQGLLLAYEVPFDFVTPQQWQKRLALAGKFANKNDRKNAHKAMAQRLWPNFPENITLDKADAMLIADYARRTLA